MAARKPRPRRGDRALRSAAKTVAYEFHMLQGSYLLLQLCRNAPHSPRRDLLNNLALETFLLHARALRDFFTETLYPDDVLAADFLPVRLRLRFPILGRPAVRERINKLLAHPSYARPRLRRAWQIPEMYQEVCTAWETFLHCLEGHSTAMRSWFP